MYQIKEEEMKAIITELGKFPYNQVGGIINFLTNLPKIKTPYENEKYENEKKYKKEAKAEVEEKDSKKENPKT